MEDIYVMKMVLGQMNVDNIIVKKDINLILLKKHVEKINVMENL